MKSEIFRLAAILYVDNNYEVSSKTIYRKIVEAIFIENDNNILNTHDLIDEINIKYGFDFTEEEIINIVKNDKNFITSPSQTEGVNISLSKRRYDKLVSKIDTNNIDYFITKFIEDYSCSDPDNIRTLLYEFLYNLFQTNITSFSKLLDPYIEIKELVNINDYNLNPQEIDVINEFLNWDNDEKNKVIFDISSYALEYSLITNKKGANFKLNSLKNKNFYLDANVIFRAIGLNGKNRKKRTLTFLEKFSEANENLFISRYTDIEIRKTINYHVNQISRYNKSGFKVNSKIFNEFSKSEDFLSFYHEWRVRRNNDSLNLFKSHILAKIDELKKDYSIKNDFKDYFTKDEEEVLNISSKISTFKANHKLNYSPSSSDLIDAKNIFLIKFLRGGNFTNIFDCKYFLISSDQILRKWDFKQDSEIPIVLLPSQWMSILLRYISRTEDDFKSFVSFLNINNPDAGINNEELQLVLEGISEITSDIEQQSKLLEVIVSTDFNNIINSKSSDEEIVEKSKKFAKTKLEEEFEKLKNKTSMLELNSKQQKEKLIELKSAKDRLKEVDTKKDDKLHKIVNELADKDVLLYKNNGYWFLLIIIVCLIYFIFLFFFSGKTWNIVALLTKYANSLPDGSMEKEVCKNIWLLPLALLGFSSLQFYNRIFNPKSINKKRKEAREEYYKKND